MPLCNGPSVNKVFPCLVLSCLVKYQIPNSHHFGVSKIEGGKEGHILFKTHSTHYIYGYMASDHLDSERGNPMPPLHGLIFPISSKGYFICTIPQTG